MFSFCLSVHWDGEGNSMAYGPISFLEEGGRKGEGRGYPRQVLGQKPSPLATTRTAGTPPRLPPQPGPGQGVPLTPARTRTGVPLIPARTRTRGIPLDITRTGMIHRGWYASCGHAGVLSCCFIHWKYMRWKRLHNNHAELGITWRKWFSLLTTDSFTGLMLKRWSVLHGESKVVSKKSMVPLVLVINDSWVPSNRGTDGLKYRRKANVIGIQINLSNVYFSFLAEQFLLLCSQFRFSASSTNNDTFYYNPCSPFSLSDSKCPNAAVGLLFLQALQRNMPIWKVWLNWSIVKVV